MRKRNCDYGRHGFSMVEVVAAIGLVGFSVLATIGLLSIGGDTAKRAKDESTAGRLVENEFERLRSLSFSSGFWPAPAVPPASPAPPAYASRYYDSNFSDLGTTKSANAIYELDITFTAGPTGTADFVANADLRYPANALANNQSVYRFTALMNIPSP